MPTVDEMMTGVRRCLGDTAAQRPSESQVLRSVLNEVQAFYNEASLMGQAWAVNEWLLKVSAGTQDYDVPREYLGKPLQILTHYPENPSHIEREIPFYEVQNLNTDWNNPNNFGELIANADGSPNTAMRMSLFYDGPLASPKIRVKPTPMRSAEYKITAIVGDIGSFMKMQTEPMLSQHHSLIEVRAAMQLLPFADWTDNEEINHQKRKELAMALRDVRDRYQHNFTQHVKSTVIATRINYRRTYAI